MSARQTADGIAARLAAHGAHAVALIGSVARGDAHSHSDVDLIAIGDGPEYALEVHDGTLVSISWRSAARVREQFDDPLAAGGVVPAWRFAVLLSDPHGAGAALQSAAQRWDWNRISPQCDRLVGTTITGLVEEVFRIVGLRNAKRRRPVAVLRGVLTHEVAKVMAVHDRLFYDSENAMWDAVCSVMGHEWERDFDIAVGLTPGNGDLAALALYRLAANRAERVLTQTQRSVVHAGIAAIEHAS